MARKGKPIARSTWKARERQIARRFGTERTALSGGNGKVSRSDSHHPRLFIEAKARQRHSAVTLWRETAELAKLEGKLPVCCLSEKGKPGFWVVAHVDDLKEVAKELLDDILL